MIFGYFLVAAGWAVTYWGIHHFPHADCSSVNGCRYSLFELLGIPAHWDISYGAAVQLNQGPEPQGGGSNSGQNTGPNTQQPSPAGGVTYGPTSSGQPNYGSQPQGSTLT